MLNRAALIVRPKQPYLDWATGLDDSGLVPDVTAERTVYLIPAFGSDEEGQKILRQIYTEVFERSCLGGTLMNQLGPSKAISKPF